MTSSREKKKIVWGLSLEDALRFFPKGLKMFALIRATGTLGNLSCLKIKDIILMIKDIMNAKFAPLIYRKSEVFILATA